MSERKKTKKYTKIPNEIPMVSKWLFKVYPNKQPNRKEITLKWIMYI